MDKQAERLQIQGGGFTAFGWSYCAAMVGVFWGTWMVLVSFNTNKRGTPSERTLSTNFQKGMTFNTTKKRNEQ